MKKIRIAVVGIGNMGSSHCLKLHEGQVKDGELVAVCDVKTDRLAWAKETFGPELRVFESYDKLLEAQVCDALIIATPHYDHPPMTIKGLEAGYHVLCEKPIGVYSKAVEAVNKVARKSDKVFTIMYNQRTNPVYQKVRKMIQEGELGQITRVNWVMTDWFRSERYFQSGGWRATWEGEGGGVLLNQCPHQIDLIQWLCGMPSKVRAFAKYGAYHDIEVEDDVTAYLEFENGATGTFITSTGEAPGVNRLEITGENGRVKVEGGQITFYKNKDSMFDFSKTTQEAFARPEMETVPIEGEGIETGHVGIMQNFVNAIIDGEAQLSPGLDGINGLSLSNAIHLSSWLDDWVTLPVDGSLFYDKLQEKISQSTYKKTTVETTFSVEGSH